MKTGQIAEAAMQRDGGDGQITVAKQGCGPFQPMLGEQIKERHAEFLSHDMTGAIDAQAKFAGQVGKGQMSARTVIDDMQDATAAIARGHGVVDADVVHPAFKTAGKLAQTFQNILGLFDVPGRQPGQGHARRKRHGAQYRQRRVADCARSSIEHAHDRSV